jgi:hypothetical protein
MDCHDPARTHPPVDVIIAQPRIEELRSTHHAVLGVRQRREFEVLGGFAAHIAVYPPRAEPRPLNAGVRALGCAR